MQCHAQGRVMSHTECLDLSSQLDAHIHWGAFCISPASLIAPLHTLKGHGFTEQQLTKLAA